MREDVPAMVVRKNELEPGDPTPGMQRLRALETERMWSGLVHTEPGAQSSWHHHGDYATTLYVVDGVLRMESGPGGGQLVEAHPGDFVHVPPHAIHRESNPTDRLSTAVIVRCGSGIPTVNVDRPAGDR